MAVTSKARHESWKQTMGVAVFRVFHDLAQDTNVTLFLTSVLWFLDFCNLLLLPLGPSHALPWEQSREMQGLWQFIQYLWFIPGAGEHFPAVPYDWAALYAILAAWMCIVLALFCWLTYVNVGYSEYAPSWMLVALRISARVAIHGLWGTIIMNLVDPFVCEREAGATWRLTGLPCWTGGHLALVVFSVILLAAVLVYHLMLALTFISREPDYTGKKNVLGAAHGRVDAAMLILKTGLAIFYVFAEENATPISFLLPAIVAGLAWLYLYLRYQPYYKGCLNGMQTAMAALYVSACACGLVAAGVGGSNGAQSGSVAFFFSAIIVFFSGWALYAYYSRRYGVGDGMREGLTLELTSPFFLELRARAILADAVASGVDPRTVAQAKGGEDYYASAVPQGKGSTSAFGLTRVDMSRMGDASHDTARLLNQQTLAVHQADSLAQAREVRDQVAGLWQDGSKMFSNNSLLHLFWANFQASVTKNYHLERLLLREASNKADWSAVDVHFFAWSRTLTLEIEADAAGATKMNVERRMRFERLLADSHEAVASVRDNILVFWTELSGKSPDLVKLQTTGKTITAELSATDAIFKTLVQLAPQNASVIRSYAEFLLELANDPKKAQELLADAEQIEDDSSSAHASKNRSEHAFATVVQDFDLSAESVGTLRVSSDRANLGAILDANLSVCRLVGYSQRELVGRPLADLVPQPIGQVHDAIMENFLQVGETRFLGTSRLSFVLHRGGFMVPARMFVQPTGEDFHAVLDLAATPPGEAYIWCLGAEQGWTVTAVCELGMTSLGIDAAALRAGAVSLSNYVGDVPAMMSALDASGQAKAVVTKASAMPGMKSRSSLASFAAVFKGQQVVIPAVGAPLWMLRMRREQEGSPAASFRISSSDYPTNVPDSTDSEREADSDGALDSPASDSRQQGRAGARGGFVKRAPTPPPSHAAGKGRQGDVSMCPVMTGTTSKRGGGAEPSGGSSLIVRGGAGGGSYNTFAEPAAAGSTLASLDLHQDLLNMMHIPGAVTASDDAAGIASSPTTLASLTGVDSHEGNAPSVRSMLEPHHKRKEAFSQNSSEDSTRLNPSARDPSSVHSSRFSLAPTAADEGAGRASHGKKKIVLQLPEGHKDSFIASGSDASLSGSNLAGSGEELPSHTLTSPAKARVVIEPLALPSAGRAKKSPRHDVALSGPASLSPMGDGSRKHGVLKTPTSSRHASEEEGHRLQAPQERRPELIPVSAPGSVHSKGSGASSGSLSEVVRKGVSARSGRLEGSLLTLRWAVLLTFAVTAALNLAAYIVTQDLVSQMMRNLDLVEKNARRAILAQRMFSDIQSWRGSAIGLAAPVDMVAERARHDRYLEEYTALNRELYLAVDGSLPEETDLYTNASALPVRDLRRVTHNVPAFDMLESTVRLTNLANAASELATRMRTVLALNASQILFIEPTGNVYWIAANGPYALSDAMNRSLILANERSASQGGRIKSADVVILVVSEIMFLLVILGAIVPAVLQVSRAKHAVFDTFIQVPLPVVRALRAGLAKKIEVLAAAEYNMETVVDVAGDEDEVSDLKAALNKVRAAGPGSHSAGANWSDPNAEAVTDNSDLVAAVNASVNTTAHKSPRSSRKSPRQFKKSGTAMLLTLVSFIWPVIAYAGYFAVLWWHKGLVVDHAAADRAQLLWSAQVEVYIRLSAIRLRFAYQFCDVAYVNRQLDGAEATLSFTESLVNQLLYGSAFKGLPVGLQQGDSAYNDLWLSNACFEDQSWYYSMDDCRSFRSGLMTRGLLGAVVSYGDIARALFNARRVSVAAPGCNREILDEPGTPKQDLALLSDHFLAAGFSYSTKLQYKAASRYLSTFQETYRAIVGSTIAALLLFYIFIYAPQIQRLDREIKHVRLLLLLFPDEVARAVPCVVAAGKQLLADAGSASSALRK